MHQRQTNVARELQTVARTLAAVFFVAAIQLRCHLLARPPSQSAMRMMYDRPRRARRHDGRRCEASRNTIGEARSAAMRFTRLTLKYREYQR